MEEYYSDEKKGIMIRRNCKSFEYGKMSSMNLGELKYV